METRRAFDFIYHQLETAPIDDALAYKVNGNWKKYSTKDVIEIVHKVSLGLLKLGLKSGDRVAIISPNRPEWNFIDLGCQEIGIVTVPMYPTITVDDYQYIFEHAAVKAVFAADAELIEKVNKATQSNPIDHIYSFDKLDGVNNWKKILSLDLNSDESHLVESRSKVSPDDLLTIIYTSGTTGRPKGVMLSHANVVSNVMGVSHGLSSGLVGGKDRIISFLPMCHIFERTAAYFYQYNSLAVYYAESMDTIGENIKEIKPQMFTTVPRLLEKVYDKIISKGYELPLIKRKLFFWAVNLGLRFDPDQNMGWYYDLKLGIARKLIFSKWREALGNELKLIASGAAALQPRLSRIFWAAQIPVFEAYGLTETSPGICANTPMPNSNRIGTVGKPLSDVEVRIADDGEILCQGPNVMMGYYKNSEMTAEVIKDGWFHTGDIGVIEDGFLRITDRKKAMFKTSGGKYIAPQLMENKFKESMFIEQIMVIGEAQKFPSALIVPNYETLQEWAINAGIVEKDHKILARHPQVLDLYQREIDKYNDEFGNWEQIKKFEIVDSEWSVDTGELTPTMKLKRRIIKDKFKDLIERIYIISS